MSNLDHLLMPPPAGGSRLWATVTQASPLRIRLDGETTALDLTPDTLIGGLQVGDRVWVELATNDDPVFAARRLVVVGRGGGQALIDYSGSFAFTAASSNPTLGNTAVSAWYTEGPWIDYDFDLTIGNTGFAAGSGEYRISLPVEAADPKSVGSALIVDVSVPTFFVAVIVPLFSDLTKAVIYRAVAGTPTGAAFGSSSLALAAGDVIRGSIRYRRA